MIESTNFFLGEKKRVTIGVESICAKPIEVTNARYSLFLGGELEASGDCEVEQLCDSKVKMSALIKPMAKDALYLLRYHYTIYPEEFEYLVHVRVR